MRTLALVLAIVLAGGALAACSSPQQHNSPTPAAPTATATVTPAAVPTPTLTQAPTSTATPTATPTPKPTIPIARSAPEVVTPIFGPIHVNWVKIGEARNSEEVLALPIPWDQVIQPVNGVPWDAQPNRDLWVWLFSLNQPDSYWGPGKGTVAAYLITEENLVAYGYSSRGGDGADYWKAEVPLSEIKGLRP